MSAKKSFLLFSIFVAIIFFIGGYFLGDYFYWKKIDVNNKTEPLEAGDSTAIATANKLESYKARMIFLPLYAYNAYTFEEEYSCFIGIPASIPLKSKLEILAAKVSSFSFGGNPIELVSLNLQNNLWIARINLKEKSDSHGWGWGYFQGSTGGSITKKMLLNSFLQEEFTGEWIDGVEFTYENKIISSEEWDHISLEGINYRKQREIK
jgi:hypothetical protein